MRLIARDDLKPHREYPSEKDEEGYPRVREYPSVDDTNPMRPAER